MHTWTSQSVFPVFRHFCHQSGTSTTKGVFTSILPLFTMVQSVSGRSWSSVAWSSMECTTVWQEKNRGMAHLGSAAMTIHRNNQSNCRSTTGRCLLLLLFWDRVSTIRLAWSSGRGWRWPWPWPSDTPASTSQLLRWPMSTAMTGWRGTIGQTQPFLYVQ